MIDRDALPCAIQVQSVRSFSYGQYDSGEVSFWAAGKAGWLEIKPVRPYKDIYNDMTEAINILYFAADFFRGRKSKQARRVGVDVVFAKVRPIRGMTDLGGMQADNRDSMRMSLITSVRPSHEREAHF